MRKKKVLESKKEKRLLGLHRFTPCVCLEHDLIIFEKCWTVCRYGTQIS